MPDNHNLLLPMFSPMAQPPTKRYRTIVADPPWHYELRKDDPSHRARAPYGTMSAEELMCLPVGGWAEDDAHLYLWTTNAHMVEAHQIAKSWGFDVKTIITWLKGRMDGGRLVQHMGTGNYFRGATEHILFCIRGSFPVMNHDATTAFLAPRREHSEKPDTFYDIVQHMSPGPYLDVFARKQRMGWDCFGNEVYNPSELLATLTDEQADGLVPAFPAGAQTAGSTVSTEGRASPAPLSVHQARILKALLEAEREAEEAQPE